MTQTFTLITGASRGIGAEFAKVAAGAGQNLILVARDQSALASLKAELESQHHITVECWTHDLSVPGVAQKLLDQVQAQSYEVDILINNAGYGLHGKFLDLNPADEAQMLQLNMITLTEMVRTFSGPMRQRGRGRILNVASTAAFQPGPLMSTYYASKAYVLSFSEALHEEFRDYGISVTTLCPGPTESHFVKRAHADGMSIFKAITMPARPVADEGFAGLMKGERLVVPGLVNKISAASPRFFPRSWVLKLSKLAATKVS